MDQLSYLDDPQHAMVEPKILIITGAGLSAESGLDTFRGGDGLWDKHAVEEICNEVTWQENYEQVHAFYNGLRQKLGQAMPNPAHHAIARIQSDFGDYVQIVTQNVDDLLERAGAKEVLHLHGELTKMQCDHCGHTWSIGYEGFDYKAMHNQVCLQCGSGSRIGPDVVFFGGRAPAYEHLTDRLNAIAHPDSIVVVSGTQGNVIPIDQYLANAACTKLLNNLEPSISINHQAYDQVWFKPASQAWQDIEAFIHNEWLLV